MRHFITPLLAAAASVLSTASASADLGDQLFKLLPKDGAAADVFGGSVAISGDIAIVGAVWDDDNGFKSGSAYLFDAATGQQVAKLLADDGAAFHYFGGSVAISGATAIVGASGDGDNGFESGAAYLFDTTTGQQIAKLLANDGAADDHFRSVGISGATAIVGAYLDDDNGADSGSAYLFDISDPANPTQLFKLLPNDGAADDQFGRFVAISGATAIVGAYRDDDNGTNSGSAYLFDAATGQQVAKLLADDGAAFHYFGGSVAISGATAIVGAALDDDNGTESGSAYLFDITTGEQIAKLLPDDGQVGDWFGYSVAISGATAIVGALLDGDDGAFSGSAYLFETTRGRQIAKLLADDGAPFDQFGGSVAISGAIAIVGACDDDDNGIDSGSAYLFDAACACARPDECDPDCNGNGIFDLCDIAAGTSLDCNSNGIPDECDPLEDCNGNGIFDSCDIADGTSEDCNANGIPDECERGDCNGNGIPDECETDCNRNGVPDDCDIADGTSEDCDGNGVPDECQPEDDCNGDGIPDQCAPGEDCNGNGVPDECDTDCNGNGVPDECEPFEDCNDNGVPDECDIADGFSVDCNGDGTPDECDIANGAFDCNANGIPDECEGVIGDLSDDGVVETTDLLLLLGNWGNCSHCDDCYADIDCDCVVGTLDLIILLGNWG